MRYIVIALWLGLFSVTPASAAVNVSIGINLPTYPRLVPVPGYPVYYAPAVNSNYFFYDGLYWVLEGDNWYESHWYNGPWTLVDPYEVPDYVLRVPVRYYRQPPVYFRGWRADASPRWGEHWGRSWEDRRGSWNAPSRSSRPAPAPLPTYQRQYSGQQYPAQVERQSTLHSQNYRYWPSEPVVQQRYQQRYQAARPSAPQAAAPQQAAPQPAARDQRGQSGQRVQGEDRRGEKGQPKGQER